MATFLFTVLWLAPLAAAIAIGVLTFAGYAASDREERMTSRLMIGGAGASLVCAVALGVLELSGTLSVHPPRWAWFASGDTIVALTYTSDWLAIGAALLAAAACAAAGRFSTHYMHREPGFHRFFLVLSLFTSASLLLVTSGNAVLTFAGWEATGLCSYLLISFFADRRTAAANATRVFVTNRIGDVGFVLGTLLSFVWLGSADWAVIADAPLQLDAPWTSAIAACFAVAAMAKSAQVPFSPWLARAMEGPTPSSALFYGSVMVHAGIYVLLRLEPLLAQTPVVAGLLVTVGAVTAAYGVLCGLAQTDMKSALAFSTIGQLGLIVSECGLGWSTLAAVHVSAHAIWRGYQFLTAPSILAQLHGGRTRPVPGWLAQQEWLYAVALQRGWLDDLATRALVAPTERFAADLTQFDAAVVDRATGLPAPAVRALSSLAGWEERRVGPTRILDADAREFATGRGVVGSLTAWAAAATDWFEDRLVVQTLSQGVTHGAHRLGQSLQWLEDQLERPAVVMATIGASLLALLSWTVE